MTAQLTEQLPARFIDTMAGAASSARAERGSAPRCPGGRAPADGGIYSDRGSENAMCQV